MDDSAQPRTGLVAVEWQTPTTMGESELLLAEQAARQQLSQRVLDMISDHRQYAVRMEHAAVRQGTAAGMLVSRMRVWVVLEHARDAQVGELAGRVPLDDPEVCEFRYRDSYGRMRVFVRDGLYWRRTR